MVIILSVYVTSNGCEDGRLSSAQVEQFFSANGSRVVRDPTQADLVIFYACGLTKDTEHESLKIIEKLKQIMMPSARLIVWGCLPKIEPRSLATVYDGPIVGPTDTAFFEKILPSTKVPLDEVSANFLIPAQNLVRSVAPDDTTFKETHSASMLLTWHMIFLCSRLAYLKDRLWGSTQSEWNWSRVYWIRVSTGCTGHCTYCSDRCAWGRVHSRPIHNIISDFERGLRTGYNCFFLVSPDIGAYGVDSGSSLPDLLETMVQRDQPNYKILLNELNPHHLMRTYDRLEGVFESGRIYSLGSQVESGSNRILKLMGRTYAAEDWKSYMQRIQTRFPKIRLSTHFMVGFPTETEEDFKMTLKLLDDVFLDHSVVFRFSPRQNVPASRLTGQVSARVARERANRLRLKANVNTLNRKIRRLIWT